MSYQGTQLTIPWVSDGDDKNMSLLSASSDKLESIQRFLNRGKDKDSPSVTQVTVNQYSPGRRDTSYYRISWNEGKKKKHLHIRGGNIYSQLAQDRAEEIKEMCDRNLPLEEIIAAVKSF